MTVSFLELRTYRYKSGGACATDSIKVSGVPTLPRPWSVTDTSTAENEALFAAVLVMMAYGLCKDPKLGIRSGISEKKFSSVLLPKMSVFLASLFFLPIPWVLSSKAASFWCTVLSPA